MKRRSKRRRKKIPYNSSRNLLTYKNWFLSLLKGFEEWNTNRRDYCLKETASISVQQWSNVFLQTSSRNNNSQNCHNSQLRASNASPRRAMQERKFEILPSRRNSRFELIISLILGRPRIGKFAARRWQPSTRGMGFSGTQGRSSPRFECQLLAFCSAAEKQGDIPSLSGNKNYSRNRRGTTKLETISRDLQAAISCKHRGIQRKDVRASFAEAFLIEFVAEQKFREELSFVPLSPLAKDSHGIP